MITLLCLFGCEHSSTNSQSGNININEAKACFEETGNGGLAREYAQVWPYVVSFLDKLVAVLGSERVPMRDMRALIEAGFGEARVAIIPPGHDQVLIGDMERSRLAGIRVLFFVGVNEGLIPKAPDYRGALTEADRVEALALGGTSGVRRGDASVLSDRRDPPSVS